MGQHWESGEALWIECEIESPKMDDETKKYMSASIAKITIKNDVNNCYPVIHILFHLDSQDILERDLYTEDTYTLKIYCIQEGKKISEPLVFNLLVLQQNISLPPKYDDNVSDKRDYQYRVLSFTCIPLQAYKIWSFMVNRLWEDKIDIFSAAKKLIEDVGITDMQVEDKGKNEYKIPQLIVPPMSFGNALDDLHTMYGIYHNHLHKYVRHNGTFEMWDVVEHFNDNKEKGEITIYKIPSYSFVRSADIKKAHEECKTDWTKFITYSNIYTVHRATDGITSHGNQQIHNYHPDFDITYIKDVEVLKQDVIDKHGINDGDSKKVKYNKEIKIKKSLSSEELGMFNKDGGGPVCCPPDDTGGKINDYFICSRRSNELLNYNMIKIGIEREVKIHWLMRVGHTLKLIPLSEHETLSNIDYEGSYVLMSSEINITRSFEGTDGDQMNVSTTLIAGRTNQAYK